MKIGHHANGIEAGQIVDDSHQIARQGLNKVDAAARLMDHANAWRRACPECVRSESLKERKVAPLQEENDEKKDADGPVCREPAEECRERER